MKKTTTFLALAFLLTQTTYGWSLFSSKETRLANTLKRADKILTLADTACDNGEIATSQEQYQKALALYEEMNKIDNSFKDGIAEIRIDYCLTQLQNLSTPEQTEEPTESEEEIIKVEASSTAKKIIDEGEEDFESYDPANFDLDLRDVRTYIQDGNLNAASELLIPMFKYSPSSYEVRLLLAIVRTRQGRPDEAIVALEDLRGTREDLPCLLALSGAYFAANRPHDAIFTLDKACKIAPQDPAPYMNLAYIFNTMKDNTKNAEVYYRAAIKRGATRDRNFEKTLGIKKW